MTHPALNSISESIEAINAALECAELSIIQRQILTDMRDDLESVTIFDTFADVCEAAVEAAKRGHIF